MTDINTTHSDPTDNGDTDIAFSELPPPLPTAPTTAVTAFEPEPPRKRGGTAGYVIAGVVAVGAIVLGVLYIGASGEAADTKSERDQLATDLQDTNDQLASAQDELASAQAALHAALADNATAQDDIAALQADVDELQAVVDEFQANGGKPAVSDSTALFVGQSFGADATPPFTKDEALCFGRALYVGLDLESLYRITFALDDSQIGEEHILELANSLVNAADQCDIAFSRIPN